MRVFKILTKRVFAASTSNLCNRRTFMSCTRAIKCQPSILDSPWFATQLRCARFSGGDVRVGNVIERRGKIYQVVKAHHTTQGRGGAIIQFQFQFIQTNYLSTDSILEVELRDIDSGSKSNERLRTDEPIEKVFVYEKSLTYLYTDDESGNIVLMDPDTYSQLEVPRHLFGESLVYLQDDMKVTVQLYDERPMSASIPNRVTCRVAEASDAVKGTSSGATPYKKVLLDNGVIVQVPAHVLEGDNIIINTTDGSYVSRA